MIDNREIDRLVAKHITHARSRMSADVADEWSHYSTDIAAAWEMLESRFPHSQFYVLVRRTNTGNWRCDIEHNYVHGPTYSAFDVKAPRAICLAALCAMGIDRDWGSEETKP